ncbi:hypothetical protein TWF106_008866 [Orbilia oligospora]|uniref:SUN domain-containing protein n=1 Tax=Orbilia oligospora TaxID=2813651 RepID=A0A7C8QIV7_ORBOL|nr:hypothetical protein TWF191_001126 [Orbilia oligospora]KAF3215023.1 hypothetical protein TWF106_008866 [Orbilia oligospora]
MAGRRSNRAGPAFSGNNLIQSNPLPPLTAIPSFSYGSPQSALPKPMSARDTKVNMTDALDRADAAAKARLEAAAKERKLAEQRAAEAAAESARQSARQISGEPPMTARKRSLRSQSVVSQDDNFYEGDETSLEIHRIIESARNPVPEASMLRARSANAGTKEPRSAMKGSREEALRPSAKTRAKYTAGSRRTVPMTPVPIDGERDVTFDEENQALGIAPRLGSPSFVSPSPAPQPFHEDVPPAGSEVFNNRQNSPPDTVGYNEGISNLPMSPASPNDDPSRPQTSLLVSQQASVTTSWFSPAKTGLNSVMGGIQKTAVILGIFFRNLFGPLLYYLLLGFFIFGITTLSYNFIQRSSYSTSNPPSSSDELIYRLMTLEKQVVEFQKGQELEKRSYKTMEQQLVSIRGAMATYSSVSSQLDKHTRNYQTDRRASSAAMSTMSAQIDQFDRSIKRNDEAAKEQQGNLKIVASQVTEIQGEIEGINKGIQTLQKSQELSERAFQRIEESLPKQLAARVDPQTGKLIVAPELLRYLQTVLREDIQSEMNKFAQPPGGSSAAVGSNSGSYNWQDFLKTNAAKLQGYIGDISEEKWRRAISDGIVVTREDMMKVIREQLDSARGVAEKDNDLMRKLVLEAEGVANNVASRAATSISSAALAAVTNHMRNFQGSSTTSSRYGDALIQAALHQYSATILQKPDYALLAHGTLIDPRLTSSTYDPYDTPGLLGKLTAFLRPGPNEPAHILTESTNVGDCWSFPQASGQVSLLLAEPIYPTDVTIDHVPKGISGDVSSAPQEIEVWVKIEDEFLRDQAGKAASVAIGEVSDNASTRHYLANGYVRVASFIYDINSQYPIQTFALPIELEKLGVSVRSDQFEGQETAARI